MSVSAMGIFRFFVCLFLLLLSSVSFANDIDNDGLPDDWEDANGLNKFNYTDAASDADNDGLTALEEYQHGTSPEMIDTDRDSLNDLWEIENNRDPTLSDFKLKVSNYGACILSSGTIQCWGDDRFLNPPGLDNPRNFDLSWSGNRACALDDSGVVCWGQVSQPNFANNTNLIDIAVTDHDVCILGDNGVACQGLYAGDVPILQNPSAIYASRYYVCAKDDTGVICWGNSSYNFDINDWSNSVSNISSWSGGNGRACILDFQNNIYCAGFGGPLLEPHPFDKPTEISGDVHIFALDNNSISFWTAPNINYQVADDSFWDPPSVTLPAQLSIGRNFGCVMDNGEIRCWGDNSFGETNTSEIMIDLDNDGYSVQGGYDVFPFDPEEWLDTDFDGIGNNADMDDDGDGVNDTEDAFPLDSTESLDSDNDGVGDIIDAFPNDASETTDTDEDGVGDNADNCIEISNTIQLNTDSDELGDACDIDDDNDGIQDVNDDFPLDTTEQLDTDADGIGNNADTDDDGDGIEDGNDAFPLNGLYSVDSDNDGMADAWEILYGLNPNDPSDTISDQDDDGAVALQEFIEGTLPVADADNDGLSDNYEVSIGTNPNNADTDNDGVNDKQDSCPLLPNDNQLDTDGDSIGDACDSDADNDGLPNDYETANGLNSIDASDAQSDSDMDGLTALEEFNLGTSPTNDDTDRDTLPDGWEVENGRDPLVADYQISMTHDSVCFKDDNGINCWGVEHSESPFIPNDGSIDLIRGGAGHRCALIENDVQCWGINSFGATDVPDLENPSYLSVGDAHNCVIDNDVVNCWGYDYMGAASPPILSNPKSLSLGAMSSCAIDDTGVVCWGDDRYGLASPPLMTDVKQISVGGQHACAINSDDVICWGLNDSGELNVPDLVNPSYISAGYSHTCAIDDTGLVCWGSNSHGQISLPDLTQPAIVQSWMRYTCALSIEGLSCWGRQGNDDLEIPSLLIDPDNDGINNHGGFDKLPLDSTEWLDTDLDGTGNNADLDDDNDGFEDTFEIQNGLDPLLVNLDIDNDGIANELDTDNDNDGSLDTYDAFPLDANEQIDSDADGIGDNADADNDNDGVINSLDLFPLDAFESADSDGDGVGDNGDFFPNSAEYSLDSDLDQMPDAWERKYGLNPTDASDALLDQDNDGLTALEEYEAGTIPLKILDIDANGSVDALTDGLIILRYLFNLRGDSLVNGALGDNAMRTNSADVAAYIQSLMPGS
jgi:hypothetical protein